MNGGVLKMERGSCPKALPLSMIYPDVQSGFAARPIPMNLFVFNCFSASVEGT